MPSYLQQADTTLHGTTGLDRDAIFACVRVIAADHHWDALSMRELGMTDDDTLFFLIQPRLGGKGGKVVGKIAVCASEGLTDADRVGLAEGHLRLDVWLADPATTQETILFVPVSPRRVIAFGFYTRFLDKFKAAIMSQDPRAESLVIGHE